jgi:hypothetical protein
MTGTGGIGRAAVWIEDLIVRGLGDALRVRDIEQGREISLGIAAVGT